METEAVKIGLSILCFVVLLVGSFFLARYVDKITYIYYVKKEAKKRVKKGELTQEQANSFIWFIKKYMK